MSAAPALLEQFDKVRPPYNVNVLTQVAAEFALDHIDVLNAQADAHQRRAHRAGGRAGGAARRDRFPVGAPISCWCACPMPTRACAKLLADKVMIKNMSKMHGLLANCIRVTVSTPEENAAFLDCPQGSTRADVDLTEHRP